MLATIIEIDDMLLATLEELEIPYYVIGGSFGERMTAIVETFDLPTVMDLDEAMALADNEYGELDMRLETERAQAVRG